jgi:predicted permease
VPSVTPNYFEILGLQVLQGRGLTAADRADSLPVVVINEAMARALWPGESPLGKRIGDTDPAKPNWREVVGVVSDTQPTAVVEASAGRFQMYRPWAQAPLNGGTIIVRTSLAPESLLPELRRAVAEIDPTLPLRDAGTVRHEVDLVLGNLHLAGGILAAFAGLGVLLAALGIYGVMASHVVQRTNEIGVRMALGAQVRDVLRLVLGQGLKLTLLGAALGLAGAFAAGRLLASMMPGLPAENLLTVVIATALLVATSLLACWLPARRATKVDPMIALRAE